MRWAIIDTNNTVENVIIWDGVTAIEPYTVSSFVQLEENERCGIGWLYNSTNTPRFTESEVGDT